MVTKREKEKKTISTQRRSPIYKVRGKEKKKKAIRPKTGQDGQGKKGVKMGFAAKRERGKLGWTKPTLQIFSHGKRNEKKKDRWWFAFASHPKGKKTLLPSPTAVGQTCRVAR